MQSERSVGLTFGGLPLIFVGNAALLESHEDLFHAHACAVPVANAWEGAQVDGSIGANTRQVHLVDEFNGGSALRVVIAADDSDGEESAVELAVLSNDGGVPRGEGLVVGVVESK